MMISTPKQHVFIVNNEPKVLDVVGETLGNLGVEVTRFVRAARCYESLRTHRCDLLITDLKMPETDGMEFLTNVKLHTPWVPVLAMISDTDMPTAARAIKAGAIDLIEKPPDTDNLVRIVKPILEKSAMINAYASKPLNWIETKVLRLVLDGNNSNEIAHLLSLPVSAVKVHRANMMHKLGVNNLISLVKWATRLRLIDLQVNRKDERRKGCIRRK